MTKPPQTPTRLVSAAAYRATYDPLTGFERVCSLARQRRNLAFLEAHRPRRILEVGCGAMILAEMAQGLDLDFDLWVIVEPEPDFVAAARPVTDRDGRLTVVSGYLQDSHDRLGTLCPEGFDAVLLAGVLHETAEPADLLAHAMRQTAAGGHVLASVPNAASFHRLLAVAAGIIPHQAILSPRDLALGHPVVFDAAGLRALMLDAGLTGVALDGYLFKPLTHAQLETALDLSDPALVDGLIALGQRFPEQAAEICVTGQKPR